jgi:hypothetical protein
VTAGGALYTWGKGEAGINPWSQLPGGLAHSTVLANRLVPTLVPRQLLGGARVGRCHGLLEELALAFAESSKCPNPTFHNAVILFFFSVTTDVAGIPPPFFRKRRQRPSCFFSTKNFFFASTRNFTENVFLRRIAFVWGGGG